MSLPRLALAVIGDEISPSLDEMISFCTEHQVRRLDMRTVDGRNLLGMSGLEMIPNIRNVLHLLGIWWCMHPLKIVKLPLLCTSIKNA